MQSGEKFAIEVNFLTGRYVATFHNDRRQTEWPPHTARLFSALVAVWAENGKDPTERMALEWLESQKPPAISASDAVPRAIVSHFVPVNDASIFGITWQAKKAAKIQELLDHLNEELVKSNGKDTKTIMQSRGKISKEKDVDKQANSIGNTKPHSAVELFPEQRGKQERFYPSVTPDDSRVVYLWDSDPPDKLRGTLDKMLERVTRLGHSSSLASCRIISEHPAATHIPGNSGYDVRSIRSGQLAALEQKHETHKGIKPRSMPYTNIRYREYDESESAEKYTLPNTAGEWIVFEFTHGSRVFSSTRTVDVARAMSAAFFSHMTGPAPEEISGHRPDGSPATTPHVAFVPIPYAGFTYSDGRLLGMALSLPRLLSDSARGMVYQAVGEWERDASDRTLGFKLGTRCMRMSRLRGPATLITLKSDVWSRQSRQWVSVTPIALPRHPGSLSRGSQAARIKAWEAAKLSVISACEHVGLPSPSDVSLSLEPFTDGAHPVSHFPAFVQKGMSGKTIRRQMIHASLTFEQPVKGPLMLGTGRFFGLGLMRPQIQTSAESMHDG